MIFFRILLLTILIWLIGFIAFFITIHNEKSFINDKADAIVVLTGAKGRIDAGIELLEKGYGRHLFISGVGKDANLNDLSNHLSPISKEKAEQHKSTIMLGHYADSTEGNALESLKWLEKHDYHKIILVTSNYHMPRSLCLFRNSMPEMEIIPYKVGNSLNIKTTFLEYNKFLLCLIK